MVRSVKMDSLFSTEGLIFTKDMDLFHGLEDLVDLLHDDTLGDFR